MNNITKKILAIFLLVFVISGVFFVTYTSTGKSFELFEKEKKQIEEQAAKNLERGIIDNEPATVETQQESNLEKEKLVEEGEKAGIKYEEYFPSEEEMDAKNRAEKRMLEEQGDRDPNEYEPHYLTKEELQKFNEYHNNYDKYRTEE